MFASWPVPDIDRLVWSVITGLFALALAGFLAGAGVVGLIWYCCRR